MMDTRDRLTEVGDNMEKNKGTFVDDGKQLLGDYISHEELWACTSVMPVWKLVRSILTPFRSLWTCDSI